MGESGRELGKNGFVNGALGGTGESVSGIGNSPHRAWRCSRIGAAGFARCGVLTQRLIHTGSDYFSLCLQEHIPEDVDLVIVELGEQGSLGNNHGNS